MRTAFDVEIELDWHAGPPSVNNDEQLVPFVLNVAGAIGFETKIVEASPIGEDFAFYQVRSARCICYDRFRWALCITSP